ncbi:MAG: lipocalin family protein [Nitrospinota bacterium]|nr:lipocalin family protein [Nitrospinota bacterium]
MNGWMTGAALVMVSFFILLLSSCAGWSGRNSAAPPLHAVPQLDIQRYMGVWHEFARYPNRFQKGCYDATAEYELAPEGFVKVVNRCVEEADSSKTRKVEGKAWVVDGSANAKLKVTFFWPFYGDYWVIDLGEDYEYAVVGEPGRNYLWILSRSPEMEEGKFQKALSRIRDQGYDPSRLIMSGRINKGD